MGRKLLLSLWLTLCFAVVVNAAKDRFTLVIDAGHGGNDAGAIGRISKEKNINLNVALAFGRYVENNCPDVRVIYTRKTDIFIPLHERATSPTETKQTSSFPFTPTHCPKAGQPEDWRPILSVCTGPPTISTLPNAKTR